MPAEGGAIGAFKLLKRMCAFVIWAESEKTVLVSRSFLWNGA
jgi:hypothetical protein